MNNLKIIQINKGKSALSIRIPQINNLINEHNPHILILNELNYSILDTTTFFPGYTLEADSLRDTHGMACTGILIKDSLVYKCRKDLEMPLLSTVWVQLGLPNRKSFLIHAVYRQWQILNVPGSDSDNSRFSRFKIYSKREQSK